MKKVLVMMALVMMAGVAHAGGQDVSVLTNAQLVKETGKNLLRVGVACPISNASIALTAIGETFPIVSAFATIGATIKLGDVSRNRRDESFDLSDKTVVSYTFGSVVTALGDLGVIAYNLVFNDSLPTDEMFKHTETSYAATTALAKHFYSTEGECGAAGRNLMVVVSEVNRRKSN